MKKLFEIGSIFDWITPIWGLCQDIQNDPTLFQSHSWTFFISFDDLIAAGWSCREIEKLMDKHGVKHWGSQITSGTFFFSVPLENARWAEYIFLKYGIPIDANSENP